MVIPDFPISKYFSFYEAVDTSQEAYQQENDNLAVPVLYVMTNFYRDIVDAAREALGGPLWVSSGFRCPALNGAVGGMPTSKHCLGIAADVFQHGWDWEKCLTAANLIALYFAGKGLTADIIAEKRPDGKVWIHLERNDTLRLFTGINREYVQIEFKA